jgi:hypothetical protein
MKLTIEPSLAESLPNSERLTIDTLTNDDSTTQVVEAALRLIVCSTHAQCNVVEAARNWADENDPQTN